VADGDDCFQKMTRYFE